MIQSFSSVYRLRCIFTTLWRRYSQVWGRLCWINTIMLIYSKINKGRICFASESTLLLIVSKFEDDPSQNTKYHRSTFTLSVPSALFSGFCIVEHFLYLFFRCSILLWKDPLFEGGGIEKKWWGRWWNDKEIGVEMKYLYRHWRRIQIRRDHPSSSSKPTVM